MQHLGAVSKMTEWSQFISEISHSTCNDVTTVIQVYAPTTHAEEAEVDQFCEDLEDLLELTPKKKKKKKKRCSIHHWGLECKNRNLGDTWSNKQVGLGEQNETR